MIGLDTNVLVRYFTQDDPIQSKRATLFVESHCTAEETGFVSLVVLCELVWVLDSGYGYAKADILRLLRGMASTPALTLEHHERVSRALSLCENSGAGLADCLIACSCEGAKIQYPRPYHNLYLYLFGQLLGEVTPSLDRGAAVRVA